MNAYAHFPALWNQSDARFDSDGLHWLDGPPFASRCVRVRTVHMGKRDGDVVESALRPYLGFDLFERTWDRNDMHEDEVLSSRSRRKEA